MTGFPIGWDPASGLGMPPEFFYSIYTGASKLVGFTAVGSANKCVGSIADGSKCISTIANGSN